MVEFIQHAYPYLAILLHGAPQISIISLDSRYSTWQSVF